MKRKKIGIANLLLILYLVVLAHSVVVHQYDSELFNGIFSFKAKEMHDNRHVTAIDKKEFHFNILSNDIKRENKLLASISDWIFLTCTNIRLFLLEFRVDYYIPTRFLPFTQRCLTSHSLRAPPFVSFI